MYEAYQEVIVEGPPDQLRTYLQGLLVGKGLHGNEVIFAEDAGVVTETFFQHLAEMVGFQRRHSHLLVPAPLTEDVETAVEKSGDLELRIAGRRVIRSASFDFSYTAYSREHYDEIHGMLTKHAGVTLSPDYQPVIQENPEDEGVELYSPLHEFEASARGTATGSVPAILSLYRAANQHELIDLEPIRLHHSDD